MENSLFDNRFCLSLAAFEQRRCHDLGDPPRILVCLYDLHQIAHGVSHVPNQRNM